MQMPPAERDAAIMPEVCDDDLDVLPLCPQKSVAAVVVTYNRKALLIECLAALLRQTCDIDRIVLLDNASTDGTPELLEASGYLANPIIDYVRLAVNVGGAGGFHEGVKRAYAAGYDWLWLMDDDIEPLPDALMTMLSFGDRSKCIQGAEVYLDGQRLEWERGSRIRKSGSRSIPEGSFDPDCIPVYVGCFEGMLISRYIVSKIGFPDKRFFMWYDDIAYGHLASKYTQILYIRKTCFIKKIKQDPEISNALGRLQRRLRVRRSQRFYYLIVRNEFLLYIYIRDAVEPIRFHARVASRLIRLSAITLFCEGSLINFRALWKGAWHGWRLGLSQSKEFDVTEVPR